MWIRSRGFAASSAKAKTGAVPPLGCSVWNLYPTRNVSSQVTGGFSPTFSNQLLRTPNAICTRCTGSMIICPA